MILDKFNALKEELFSLSSKERIFIACAMLCGFLISCEYAIVRPISNSVFISAYTSSFFPYAWLATVPLNLCLVALYNKYLPRVGCLKMFAAIISCVIGVNVTSALFLDKISWLPFAFYVWKEVYIMLMFQQLWSIIHLTIRLDHAKYLYGILFGAGALGGVLGSSVPGFLAIKMGSEHLLFATIPLYLLLGVAYRLLLKSSVHGLHQKIDEAEKRSSLNALTHGVQLIFKSKLLLFILGIVICMQISSTVIDYQFNRYLEEAISLKDLRTQYTARILGIVHMATVGLQFIGAFLLIHFLGIKRSHFLVPSMLCLISISFLFFPVFAMISFSYITIKSFDFSLFGVIREIMYIKLPKDEKFRAKAVIDVFAHRTAKALASFLILGLQLCIGIQTQQVLTWLGITIFVLWCLFVKNMLKDYELTPAIPNSVSNLEFGPRQSPGDRRS